MGCGDKPTSSEFRAFFLLLLLLFFAATHVNTDKWRGFTSFCLCLPPPPPPPPHTSKKPNTHTHRYLTGWATGLRDNKGLNITALAVAYNENTYNAPFIKAMRKSLDEAGLSHVKTIAPDSWGRMWAIVKDMQEDPVLAAAIDIIGTHQECTGAPAQMPPAETLQLGKPLWSTEQHIGELGSFAGCPAGVYSNDLPVWDFRSALNLARSLNQARPTRCITTARRVYATSVLPTCLPASVCACRRHAPTAQCLV